MKKVLLASILLLFVTLSFSQGYETTKYGIRAGFNISNLNFEPAPLFTNAHRNGFFFGGFAEFMLSNSVFLNTEIQWSAEGGKDEDLRANYINLPVQLRFALSNKLTTPHSTASLELESLASSQGPLRVCSIEFLTRSVTNDFISNSCAR